MSNEIFRVSYLQYHIRLAEPTKVFLFGIRFPCARKDGPPDGSIAISQQWGARWSYGGQRGIQQ
jgi:hypothetical protein